MHPHTRLLSAQIKVEWSITKHTVYMRACCHLLFKRPDDSRLNETQLVKKNYCACLQCVEADFCLSDQILLLTKMLEIKLFLSQPVQQNEQEGEGDVNQT